MARKRSVTEAQATAHLKGIQVAKDGRAFDPTGARAGQNSAWLQPAWSMGQKPSVIAASKTFSMSPEQFRSLDPPTASDTPSIKFDLRPSLFL